MARGRARAAAVIRRTQVQPTLEHLARDPDHVHEGGCFRGQTLWPYRRDSVEIRHGLVLPIGSWPAAASGEPLRRQQSRQTEGQPYHEWLFAPILRAGACRVELWIMVATCRRQFPKANVCLLPLHDPKRPFRFRPTPAVRLSPHRLDHRTEDVASIYCRRTGSPRRPRKDARLTVCPIVLRNG